MFFPDKGKRLQGVHNSTSTPIPPICSGRVSKSFAVNFAARICAIADLSFFELYTLGCEEDNASTTSAGKPSTATVNLVKIGPFDRSVRCAID